MTAAAGTRASGSPAHPSTHNDDLAGERPNFGRSLASFEVKNMDDLTAEEVAFRDEVRAFLDEKFTPGLRAEAAKQAGMFAEAPLAIRWQRILHEKGWVAPAWPIEYGGPGWSARQIEIFNDECARVGTPRLPGLGLRLCAPVIMRYGSA
jgi:acyl-CoA dehydrogenase